MLSDRDHCFVGSMIYPLWPLLVFFTLFFPTIAQAIYFPSPIVTDRSSDFIGTISINGRPAQPGNEMAFFCPADDNPDGVVCGLYVVTEAGEYGIVSVFGDDPTTPSIDDGAQPGERLRFKVWSKNTGMEYSGTKLIFSPGVSIGSFVASSIPPVWTEHTGYVLNIQAARDNKAIRGDLNEDGEVNLKDAVLVLQVLTDLKPTTIRLDYVTTGADVDFNRKLALPEALYALQVAAGLRSIPSDTESPTAPTSLVAAAQAHSK